MKQDSATHISSPRPAEGKQKIGPSLSFFASLIFFTRLPWWRLKSVPKEAFEHVVDYWPFVGWLTGGVMAGVYLLAVVVGCSPMVAALLAIASRMLLTGALHEDGLADFCDGFGGGTTRVRTLEIMKDSHIGTYGVLGLLVYLGLLWASMIGDEVQVMSQHLLNGTRSMWIAQFSILLFFDVAAKCAASLITGQMPYARSAEGAKNGVVYVGRSLRSWLFHGMRCIIALALPLTLCCVYGLPQVVYLLPLPFIVELLLMLWMRRRLGGYTGDCCGALFLLCELSMYMVFPILF